MNNKGVLASLLALGAAACGGAGVEDAESHEPVGKPTPASFGEAIEPGVAYWVVSDEDSTMVLFPTIHVLPGDLDWQNEEVSELIAEADEVWFEVLPAELNDQTAVQALSMTYGMSPDRPLSERLDAETYGRLVKQTESLGLSPELMEPFRPWMAAVTLATMDLVRDGFDPASGVEMVIGAETPDAKERGLETVEQQLSFFGGLSEDVETAFLLSTLDDIEKDQQELKDFAEAWALGDLSSLEELVLDSIREVSEELYDVLITRRNQAWAELLSEELEGAGNDFVAVGAGHLIGEDGLPTLLAKRGYAVEGPLTE